MASEEAGDSSMVAKFDECKIRESEEDYRKYTNSGLRDKAMHSTLVEVMPDRVLILGDSTSGLFPEWTMDPVLAGKLAATIRGVNPEICVHGHLPPSSPEEMIREMLGWI